MSGEAVAGTVAIVVVLSIAVTVIAFWLYRRHESQQLRFSSSSPQHKYVLSDLVPNLGEHSLSEPEEDVRDSPSPEHEAVVWDPSSVPTSWRKQPLQLPHEIEDDESVYPKHSMGTSLRYLEENGYESDEIVYDMPTFQLVSGHTPPRSLSDALTSYNARKIGNKNSTASTDERGSPLRQVSAAPSCMGLEPLTPPPKSRMHSTASEYFDVVIDQEIIAQSKHNASPGRLGLVLHEQDDGALIVDRLVPGSTLYLSQEKEKENVAGAAAGLEDKAKRKLVRPGDVLVSIGGKQIAAVDQVRQVLDGPDMEEVTMRMKHPRVTNKHDSPVRQRRTSLQS
eukprot:m.333211 g.333211  ORF g.333211 m.333211 type:complete len:338 (+) comp17098_c0_seq1:320-1333(+)